MYKTYGNNLQVCVSIMLCAKLVDNGNSLFMTTKELRL